ncbi:MAG: hypothetical protein AAF628_16500 [Planctomycetota bacterium]
MAAKKKARKPESSAAPDPRALLEPTAANCKTVLQAVEAGLKFLEPPAEPHGTDLVYAMEHFFFAEGVASGYGQEAVRRIEGSFVDRNEFRVTEAFQAAELLADLGLPDLFERCTAVREAVAQVYNDQNSVSLDYLREATVTERQHFFMRVPALTPNVARFLVHLLSFEECIFAARSTVRVQQRLGFDPKAPHVEGFFSELRQLLQPYGHLPLRVGADREDGKVILEPELSPACWVGRLATAKK